MKLMAAAKAETSEVGGPEVVVPDEVVLVATRANDAAFDNRRRQNILYTLPLIQK